MNILFLGRSLEIGGAERQMVQLARGLQERGHRVAVAVFYPGGDLAADLAAGGVKLHDLGKGGRWDLTRFTVRLARLVRRLRPQVLHSYLDTPNLTAALARPLLPSLKVVWGVRAAYMDLTRYDWFSRHCARLSCRLGFMADGIIFNSAAALEQWGDRGPSCKAVVPNGIDTAYFSRDQNGRAQLRKTWGIKSDDQLVGLVARLDPMKDHANFLNAAALMCKENPQLRFVCVGAGTALRQEELKSLAARLGLVSNLHWAGQRHDMPAVYSALDLAVLSSAFGEGFPNALAEAMACRTPVVATKVGDTAWLVGDENLLTPPREPGTLARRCLALLAQDFEARQALGRSLRGRIEKLFSLEAMLERSEEVLQSLLQRGTC